MELNNFPWLSEDLLTVNCIDDIEGLIENAEITFFSDNDNWFVSQDSKTKRIELVNQLTLIETLASRSETLWLLRKIKGNDLQLQYISFVEKTTLDIEIGVTEKVAEYLFNQKEIFEDDISKACEWFGNHFLFQVESNKQRLIISYFHNTGQKSFQVIGDTWRADIDHDDDCLLVKRVTRLGSKNHKLSLLEGSVNFYNAGISKRLLEPVQQALLNSSLRNDGDYLELWKIYNEIEWERATRLASNLGALQYTHVEAVDDEQLKWEFTSKNIQIFDKFKQLWKEHDAIGKHVEVTVDVPEWSISEEGTSKYDLNIFRGEISFKNNKVIITPDEKRRTNKPPKKGYIAYSLAGEISVKRRRDNAKETIDSGIRLPQLTHLLQGLSVPVPQRKNLKALTQYAEETFKGPPTDMQIKALDVALNTPDIALIIGPPGTGKTQVIAALQRRLAEENSEGEIQHQVLISSYQHDAVDNALNRSDVYGLPAIRVGGRSNQTNDVRPIHFWCDERRKNISQKLKERRQEEPHILLLEELQHLIFELKLSSLSPFIRKEKFGDLANTINQLDNLGVSLSASVKYDWDEYCLNNENTTIVNHDYAVNNRKLLCKIRALRVTKNSFNDDGIERAEDLLFLSHRKHITFTKEERSLLSSLIKTSEVTEVQLEQLSTLKNKLLDSYIPDYRPPEIRNLLADEGVNLLNRIEESLHQTIVKSKTGVASILGRYYNKLAYAPKDAERAVENYSAIVGATCQQSASKQMSALQAVTDLDAQSEIVFETVVIDEAARANPLDLFVPMAMAKRRIILVGDDRQLPHLLEPELERDIAERENLNERQQLAYKQSLFERLRIQLLKIEKDTGVRRVVMLDTQFRMHPKLGEFVSKNFYETEGLEALKPGRPYEDFEHNFSNYEGKYCTWLDVPMRDGMEKSGKSKTRVVEAEEIARETKRLLESTDENVSIGVITFYSAQRDLINEELTKLGVIEQENIIPEYLYTKNGDERLRIGTVDAFQGKEFDIVLLSVVRANNNRISGSAEQKDSLLNRKYGHLRLSNRMNVAMSRQRKLLVVVGATEMVNTYEAKEAIPALHNFLTLCNEEA